MDSIPVGKTRHAGNVLDGRYRVQGYIGKGAMARVYLAEDLETHSPVAVKVLDKLAAREEQARNRFLREARAVKAIEHPNVVKIFDVGMRTDGMPYLVMEFLFGESLGNMLRREGSLGIDIGLPIVRQIASGLAAAHEVGVVHRDVKPDNLFLIGEPGDPYAVKVLDFGLAKLPQGSGSTSAGIAMGTIEYMAPEQVLAEPTESYSDVYALGVVLFRILTGALPFDGSDKSDILAQQLALKAPPVSLITSGIDPRLEALVARCLCKNPQHRPTMLELCHDLERLLGERDGEISPSGQALDAAVVDAYSPQTVFGREAAHFLYRRLGLRPPSTG